MKQSKSISPCRLLILFILMIYFNDFFINLLIIIYLTIQSKKELILFILLLLFFLIKTNINIDFINYGIVENVYSSSCIVNKIFYKVECNCDDINKGDLVYLKGNSKLSESIDKYKNNVYFISNNKPRTIHKNIIFKFVSDRIEHFNDDNRIILKRVLLNDYTNNQTLEDNIGHGLFIYYFLSYILNKKNNKSRIIALFLLTFDIIFFGFKDKYILIILKIISSYFDGKLDFYIPFILILFNPYYIFNASFIYFFILFIVDNLNLIIKKQTVILLISSILFGEINILILLDFRIVVFRTIFIYLMCLIVFVFSFLEPLFSMTFFIVKLFAYIDSFSIRGSLSFAMILMYFLIIKLFKIKKTIIHKILLCILILSPLNNLYSSVSFIDVGQGDSILIKSNFNSEVILLDTGSSFNYSKLKKTLFKEGIYSIDSLVISHYDDDHSGNIENLRKDFNIKTIVDNGEDINLNHLKLTKIEHSIYSNDNDNSNVYYYEINDFSFLFTGDISSIVEEELIRRYPNIKVDVLKISHHGSKNSSSEYFISKLLPKFSIISTNGKYNHPDKNVLETLNKYLSKTLITKENGTIKFIFSNICKCAIIYKDHFDIIMK